MSKRKPYPTDVSDEEWHFAAPYLTSMSKDAPQGNAITPDQYRIHELDARLEREKAILKMHGLLQI